MICISLLNVRVVIFDTPVQESKPRKNVSRDTWQVLNKRVLKIIDFAPGTNSECFKSALHENRELMIRKSSNLD